MLVASSGISSMLGLFIVYFLGSVLEWRNVALICLVVPIISMFAICFVSLSFFALSVFSYEDFSDRSLKLPCGCCPKIALMTLENLFNGCGGGYHPRRFKRSFLHCNATVNIPGLVTTAFKPIRSVLTPQQTLAINSERS